MMPMTSVRASLGGVLARLPQHILESLDPKEIFRRVYGVEPEEWSCPACGTVLEVAHYPTDRCRGCSRPLPRRCIGIPADRSSGRDSVRGCGAVVEPTEVAGGWIDPQPMCSACTGGVDRQRRTRTYLAAVPRELSQTAITSYRSTGGRRALDLALSSWLQGECGNAGGTTSVLAFGPPGTGKTMAMARAVHRAVMAGHVGTVLWLRERDLLDAHVDRYSRQEDRAERARALLEYARIVDLLVVDELWASKLTGPALDELSELFRGRFDSRRSVLGTTNAEPNWIVLGPHVESRWLAVGVSVSVGGADMRRAA